MGGDLGPPAVVAGACRALRRRDDLNFIFFGDEG
jgi:fatty acid/phospholipid biosynthesis enzyme